MFSKKSMLGVPNSLLVLDEKKRSLSHSWSQYIFFLSIIRKPKYPSTIHGHDFSGIDSGTCSSFRETSRLLSFLFLTIVLKGDLKSSDACLLFGKVADQYLTMKR